MIVHPPRFTPPLIITTPTKSNLNMLLLNSLPQLIPPSMQLPRLRLHVLYLILQSVYLPQIRIRRPPPLVLRLEVLERSEELLVGRGDGLEGVDDGAAFGRELGRLVLGAFFLLALCPEGVFGLGALVGGLGWWRLWWEGWGWHSWVLWFVGGLVEGIGRGGSLMVEIFS